MTIRICVVAEDRSGAELAWALSERAIERAADWFAEADMETRRSMRSRVDEQCGAASYVRELQTAVVEPIVGGRTS